MRSDHQRTVHELEGRVREQSSRLDVFEKLEKELDDVVLQAAESEWVGGPVWLRVGGWVLFG